MSFLFCTFGYNFAEILLQGCYFTYNCLFLSVVNYTLTSWSFRQFLIDLLWGSNVFKYSWRYSTLLITPLYPIMVPHSSHFEVQFSCSNFFHFYKVAEFEYMELLFFLLKTVASRDTSQWFPRTRYLHSALPWHLANIHGEGEVSLLLHFQPLQSFLWFTLLYRIISLLTA